ncbi:alpha/beta fold hydrolase [Rhizobium sp. RU36D]|uniref:alpha/beta hydrolase n=1 Tax=Rhizobium sp. RU36D TaxID=1907415 RepID=UPI0009D83580|nr:alpha/beta fold hydrolase [Rhizobium sp. RU36D]SMC85884.1 Esterase/lipase superfamily enzyme [Rhizobium sp. RU36D]
MTRVFARQSAPGQTGRTAGTCLSAAILISLSLVVTGCGTRPGPDVLQPVSAMPVNAKAVTVYVATTRERSSANSNVFTEGRDSKLNYARFTITTPPDHKPGNIEWPKRGQKPDPAKTFTVASQATLQKDAFKAAVETSAKAYKGDSAPIGVFVHGFNFNFQEALFRFAQLSADADIDGVPVLFSWPSQAALTGYVADKESVTYSRDYLAELLTDLAQTRQKGKIVVFGHSMGGWLVAETLRQLKLTGREDVLSRLSVVLAAPDIDADVFRQQIAVIGPMSPPMTILVSKDDRALQASSILAGNQRIGALDIADPEIQAAAAKEKVRLIDISEVQSGDRINHDRYIALATRYPKFTTQQNEVGLNNVGAFVFDAAAATVSSPFRLVSAALSSAQ